MCHTRCARVVHRERGEGRGETLANSRVRGPRNRPNVPGNRPRARVRASRLRPPWIWCGRPRLRTRGTPRAGDAPRESRPRPGADPRGIPRIAWCHPYRGRNRDTRSRTASDQIIRGHIPRSDERLARGIDLDRRAQLRIAPGIAPLRARLDLRRLRGLPEAPHDKPPPIRSIRCKHPLIMPPFNGAR